jgi:GT2 family glycosyltransferase
MNNADAPLKAVDVSICMVSLNCWTVLEPCLESLVDSDNRVTYEVIVVDNDSRDGTPERLAEKFPWVRVIRNDKNVGFTKATNQGIRESRGRLILWLNTDTILRPDSLSRLVGFLDERPNAGIAGPKVLNADLTFQPQCRRGLPTPWAILAYRTGLTRLRPHSRAFGQYLLNYLPVDEAAQVDAVSGCCLLARREVWSDIGELDEAIFQFGEDIDWCVRAKQRGWQVWYAPNSEIIHLKGHGGVHSKPYQKVWGIHQAMWVFFQKHLSARYPKALSPVVMLGIAISFTGNVAAVAARRALTRLRAAPIQ